MNKFDDNEFERAGRALLAILAAFVMLCICLGVSGCKTIKVDGGTHTRDSVRVEHRTDTLIMLTTDSVIMQLPCSDSISVAYVDRWHTQTVYKTRDIHDTVAVCSVDSIPYPVEVETVKVENSKFASFTIWFFWIIVAVIVGAVGFAIFRRFFLHS